MMPTGTVAHSPARGRALTALGVAGFAAALAAASRVAIPIPGTPVPLTLQPLVVVLAGLSLGPAAGAASMLLYIAAGVAGLPVWAPMGLPGAARLLGPTGGYILAYPVAAFVAGWLATRATSLATRSVAAVAGVVVLLLGGLAQLAILTGSVTTAVALGAHPFVALDVVKGVLAAVLAPRRVARGSP
jgi:biotin transport system substrate-specific component